MVSQVKLPENRLRWRFLCRRIVEKCTQEQDIRNLGKQDWANRNVGPHRSFTRGLMPYYKELWGWDSLSNLSHLCFCPPYTWTWTFYLAVLSLSILSRNFTRIYPGYHIWDQFSMIYVMFLEVSVFIY